MRVTVGALTLQRPGFKASFISPSYLIWGKHFPSGSLPFSLWITTLYTEQGSLEGLGEMWRVKDDHGVWHKRRPSVRGNFYHHHYYYSDSDWIWGNCWLLKGRLNPEWTEILKDCGPGTAIRDLRLVERGCSLLRSFPENQPDISLGSGFVFPLDSF